MEPGVPVSNIDLVFLHNKTTLVLLSFLYLIQHSIKTFKANSAHIKFGSPRDTL